MTRKIPTDKHDASSAMPEPPEMAVVMGLNAAIVSVQDDTPCVLVVRRTDDDGAGNDTGGWDALPFGPFDPLRHRTLEIGLRSWVQEQTKLQLGYVEQLYTFGDRGRHASSLRAGPEAPPHVVSIGYLALTRAPDGQSAEDTSWESWYTYFPWEDWRRGKPAVIEDVIRPLLMKWAERPSTQSRARAEDPLDRARLCFGFDGLPWDEERVLERYELLYEAGLVLEAIRDERPDTWLSGEEAADIRLGEPMQYDHRRILATAMSRLRGKLKYRPIVFELMAPEFTLLELQRTVEAISGVLLHKQNFRRLVERTGLVEGTGRLSTQTGGRPAEQFRFRREVLRERPAPGVRYPSPR